MASKSSRRQRARGNAAGERGMDAIGFCDAKDRELLNKIVNRNGFASVVRDLQFIAFGRISEQNVAWERWYRLFTKGLADEVRAKEIEQEEGY